MDRAGRNLMLGLASGIRQSTGTVVGYAQRAAALVGGTVPARHASIVEHRAPRPSSKAERPGPPVTINVAGITDPDALAREVMRRAAWVAAM